MAYIQHFFIHQKIKIIKLLKHEQNANKKKSKTKQQFFFFVLYEKKIAIFKCRINGRRSEETGS